MLVLSSRTLDIVALFKETAARPEESIGRPQNRAARILINSSFDDPSRQLLVILGMKTIQELNQAVVHNAHNGLKTKYYGR